MLNIILNIVGLILIIYAIITIRKDISKEASEINDLCIIENRVKEYYSLTEKNIKSFHEIIDDKLDIINDENIEDQIEEISHLNPIEIDSLIDNNLGNKELNLNPLHSKILELSSIGLTNDEIAKRLNKGKREIEIILKLYNDKKTTKTI